MATQKIQHVRRHLSENQLGCGLRPSNFSKPTGLRTFDQTPTPEVKFIPCLKIFNDKYISDQKEIDLKGRKALNLADQIQRKRPELRHIRGGQQTTAQLTARGVKVYEHANLPSNKQYLLENKLQRKARILGLQNTRNQIPVSSMGDKPYKYPEYQPNFYKAGGLIPGSTFKSLSQKNEFLLDDKKLKSIFTKPHWHEKVKIEQKQEDIRVVDSVDEWQKTTLKQNNPNWQDPQTFFQRLSAAQSTGGKDAKKGAKK